jgi:hypothetical protein
MISGWLGKKDNTDWLGQLLAGHAASVPAGGLSSVLGGLLGGGTSGNVASDPEVSKQLARIAVALEAILPKAFPQPIA